ncbi:hypothetical protein AAES_47155 [Amazona aestiva]|uniref:Uncharacterized protein n=1 Tax=Amazona aestiva TaxID=12930 RepID=A0A0Q3MRP4_AMAAE|nr:hypothetical protein AAES_47155 [Amazona aestiva]
MTDSVVLISDQDSEGSRSPPLRRRARRPPRPALPSPAGSRAVPQASSASPGGIRSPRPPPASPRACPRGVPGLLAV